MVSLGLPREDFEMCYKWIMMYLDYKSKKKLDCKPRYSLGTFGGKGKIIAWVDEEFVKDKEKFWNFIQEKAIVSIAQTLLTNEIVLEIEKDPKYSMKLMEYLSKIGIKYLPIWSGGSSIHLHLFFDKPLNNKERKEFYNFFEKRFPDLDLHGFSVNHTWRIPFTYHPEAMERSTVITSVNTELNKILSSLDFTPEFITKLENTKEKLVELGIIKVETETKQNDNKNKSKVVVYTYTGSTKSKRYKGSNKHLWKLYHELLNIKVEDGRDRVALILYTLARFLNIDKEKFENDLMRWVELSEWKEYRARWFVNHYDGDYVWKTNWWWAVKNFLLASDIEQKSYEAVKEVLQKYLPNYVKRILEQKQ